MENELSFIVIDLKEFRSMLLGAELHVHIRISHLTIFKHNAYYAGDVMLKNVAQLSIMSKVP